MALTKVNTDLLEDGGKLDGIEAGADVTDTTNVTAAGALMDSELTSIASVKALNQGVATTDSPTFAAATVTGEITANGGIALPDDGVLSLGDSDELTLKHHNSGYSHLINTTGTLYVDSDSVTFRDDDGSPSNMVISQTGIDVIGSIRGTQLEAYKTNHGGDVSVAANQVGNAYENLASTASLILGATATSTINSTKIVADHSGGATNNHVQDLVFYPVGGNSQNFEAMRISSLGALTVKNVANGHTVFNENGVDADFRVESDSNTHMVFVDASTNKVGINASAPEATLDVKTDLAITEVAAANATSQLNFYSRYSDGQRGFVVLKAESLASGSSDLVINARNAFTDAERLRIASTGDVTLTGNLLANDIKAKGSGGLTLQTDDGVKRIIIEDDGDVVINETGTSSDFRVESDGNANMLFVDAGSETVCIGHNATHPTVPNIVFDARNMVQAGQSFYQGLVASTQNNNNGFISLFNLTTAAANTVGCVFDGTLIVHSYTGFSRVRFTASRYFTNSAIAFSVADTQDGTGSAGGVHLSLVTATVGSESFLGVQKTGGGTGTSYIDAFVSGMMEIKETTSGSYTVTATHGTLIT